MKTGAIETGIGRLAMRFRHSGSLLVLVLMSVFALGGTTYGMWEETLGFFALIVPLVLALGVRPDASRSAIIFLGAGTGVIGSTVNPFATGVASDAAGISISDGIGLRLVMLAVLVPVGIAYVIVVRRAVRHGREHRWQSPMPSVVGASSRSTVRGTRARLVTDVPPLTGPRRSSSSSSALTFLIDDLRVHPVERPLAERVQRQDFPLPTFSNFYFTEAADAVHRRGGRDR